MVRYDKTLKPQEGKVGKSKGPAAKTPDLLAVGYHHPPPVREDDSLPLRVRVAPVGARRFASTCRGSWRRWEPGVGEVGRG